MSTYIRIFSVLLACVLIFIGFYGAFLAPDMEPSQQALYGGFGFLLMAIGLTLIILSGIVRPSDQ